MKLLARLMHNKHHRRRFNRSHVAQACEVLEQRTLLSAVADRFENNNTASRAKNIQIDGTAQTHSIHNNGRDVDWVKFRLTRRSSVTIETNGAAGNTRIWLYAANNMRRRIQYNSNSGAGSFSKINRSGSRALRAGTYYVKIIESGRNNAIDSYTVKVTARSRTRRAGDRYENDNLATRAKAINTNGTADRKSVV